MTVISAAQGKWAAQTPPRGSHVLLDLLTAFLDGLAGVLNVLPGARDGVAGRKRNQRKYRRKLDDFLHFMLLQWKGR